MLLELVQLSRRFLEVNTISVKLGSEDLLQLLSY